MRDASPIERGAADGQTWAIVTIVDEAITESLVNALRETPAYFDESSEGLGLALLVGRADPG